mgnify:CR=1 FL=1
MKKIVLAPYIDQTDRWVNGCESISAVMLLQAMGIRIDPDTFIERDLPHAPYWEQDGKLYGPDPWQVYPGDPHDHTGYGCYAPCIVRALNSALEHEGAAGQFEVVDESGKTAAELISERTTLDSPTMGLTTWKGAPDGKILKSDTLVAKNYLNEKELSRLNRLVTMFIDYAELMAEDEQLMSMQDWLEETDRFLTNNRRKVLEGKGRISHEAAVKKVGTIYEEFRKKQDADYISEFDRQIAAYLKGDKL